MKNHVFLFCVALFFFLTSNIAFCENPERIAVVEDSAGVTTELSNLRFLGGAERFGIHYSDHPYYRKEVVGIITDVFQLLIPTESLVSIDVESGTATVRYQWRGKEKSLKGDLVHSKLDGNSHFGNVTLSIDKLKKLAFKEPPIKNLEEGATPYTAELVLADGEMVPVANLHRYVAYYSSGHIIGTSVKRHTQSKDIRFLRGESLIIVGFEKIQKITFQSDNKITVTLKDGKMATGDLPSTVVGKDGIDGFTGTYEEGAFFLSPKQVKEIVFLKIQE